MMARRSVLVSAGAAFVATALYELTKEVLLPGLSRWGSHVLTMVYVTAAAAAIAAVVSNGFGRIRDAAVALQGWGERNEAALQAFLDAIPEAAFLVDRRHSVLRLNEPLARRLGRPRQDIIGRDVFALLRDTELARKRIARVDEVFRSGRPLAFHDANGERRYVNNVCPVLGPDGGVWAVGVVAVDITDLHQAQEKVKVNEELLRFGLTAARLGVWEWDIGTETVTVSPEAIQLLGGPARGWRGSFGAFLHQVEPQDRARVELALRTAAAGRLWREPLRFRGTAVRDQPPRWCEIQGQLFKGAAGRVRMVGTVADATARIESEARSLRAEQAVRSVTGGTAGHTGQEFFSSLAETLARSLGTRWVLAARVTPDGQEVQSLAGWADGPTAGCRALTHGALDEALVRRWVAGLAPDVPPDNLIAIAVPIVSPEGQALGLVAACDDKPLADVDTVRLVLALSAARAGAEIARLDKQEEILALNAELEQRVAERTNELTVANRELEAFSYSVSHDLRAPLRSIDGFALALLEDHGDQLQPEARGYIEIVRSESQRMGHIIDDLLQLARLTRGRLTRSAVDLSAMAGEVVCELRRRHPERQVEVTIAPGLTAWADPKLVRVVLDNLFGNAWKFTSRRPVAHVCFDAETRPRERVFSIRDDGAGFDPRLAEKLFEPFVRLHPAAEFEGTGIGLATVARIIKRHGGQISAEGRPGEGATFRWSLDTKPVP